MEVKLVESKPLPPPMNVVITMSVEEALSIRDFIGKTSTVTRREAVLKNYLEKDIHYKDAHLSALYNTLCSI